MNPILVVEGLNMGSKKRQRTEIFENEFLNIRGASFFKLNWGRGKPAQV